MGVLYNHIVFLLFLGGLFSLFLTVTIIFLKQSYKRDIERKRLEDIKRYRPEEVGDVEAKLNDSIEFQKVNFLQELCIWSIQPLLIISFASLFSQSSEIEIIGAFILILLTMLHEFSFANRFSKNIFYQLFIFLIWIVFFCMISYKANEKEKVQEQEQLQKKELQFRSQQ